MYRNSSQNRKDMSPINFGKSQRNPDSPGENLFLNTKILEMMLRPDLRLYDNPANMQLAYWLAMSEKDPDLEEIFKLVIDKQSAQSIIAINSDPWWPNYPASGSIACGPNDIICGFMPNGDPITLGQLRTFCNIGVFGRTGSSKTTWLFFVILQLIRKGFQVVVFQQKNEYDDFATDPELAGMVLPLRYEEFMVSRLQSPPGVPARSYLYTHFSDFAESSGRLYAQRLAHDIAKKEGKKLPRRLYLPLSRIIQAIENFRPGRGDVETHYRESILYALKDIQNSFGDVYDYYYSDFRDKLFHREGLVTITLDAPIAASTDAVINTIRGVYSQRKYSGCETEMFRPLVFVLEDATILTDEKSLYGVPSPLIPMSFLSRKYRIGFIVVSHNISTSVSPRLLSNLESIFLFGISDEDPRRIQRLLGCSYDQAQMAQILGPGSFTALIPSFHGKPIYGQFPEIKPPRKLSEQERQDIVQSFTKSVKAIKYINRALPAAGESSVSRNEIKNVPGLTPIEVKFLVLAGTCRWLIKTQLYQVCGLNRRTGKKVSDQLEKKGIIVTCCIGRLSFIDVTPLGWIVLNSKGIEKPIPKTNGGFEHELAVELIKAWESAEGNSMEFEIDLFGKRLDAGSHDRKSGKRRFYNIGVTDPIREVESLIEIAQIPIVKNNEMIFVARDKKFASQVIKVLKKKDSSGKLVNQVVIKTIADFVNV